MRKASKKYVEASKKVEKNNTYSVEEAIKLEFSLLDAFIIGKATEQECKQLAQSIQSTLFQMDDDVPSKRLYLKQLKDYENKFKLIK